MVGCNACGFGCCLFGIVKVPLIWIGLDVFLCCAYLLGFVKFVAMYLLDALWVACGLNVSFAGCGVVIMLFGPLVGLIITCFVFSVC